MLGWRGWLLGCQGVSGPRQMPPQDLREVWVLGAMGVGSQDISRLVALSGASRLGLGAMSVVGSDI